jgi:peptidoglycan/LPS O-acetylase OafA/YrhL
MINQYLQFAKPKGTLSVLQFPKLTWNPRIEGLRGVAILLVFFAHINPDKAHNWGTLGVGIFFVISGFVITGSLCKLIDTPPPHDPGISNYLKVFYIRRAKRLLPLAFLTILTTLLVSYFDSSSDTKQYLLSSLFCLFYVGNFFGYTFGYTDLAPAIGHFWSLCVEEQFYFIWPILFYFFTQLQKRFEITSVICFGICVTQISHPLIALMNKTPYTLPTTYLDLLFFGCLMFMINEKAKKLTGLYLLIIKILGYFSILIAVFSKSFSSDGMIGLFRYNLFGVLAAVIFVFSLNVNLLNNYVLRYFGKISYSLYCIHWPLFYFWRTFIGGGFMSMLCAGVLSILLSAFSYKYFESRFYSSQSRV